jgi:hypothetical protein
MIYLLSIFFINFYNVFSSHKACNKKNRSQSVDLSKKFPSFPMKLILYDKKKDYGACLNILQYYIQEIAIFNNKNKSKIDISDYIQLQKAYEKKHNLNQLEELSNMMAYAANEISSSQDNKKIQLIPPGLFFNAITYNHLLCNNIKNLIKDLKNKYFFKACYDLHEIEKTYLLLYASIFPNGNNYIEKIMYSTLKIKNYIAGKIQ